MVSELYAFLLVLVELEDAVSALSFVCFPSLQAVVFGIFFLGLVKYCLCLVPDIHLTITGK